MMKAKTVNTHGYTSS